MLASMVAAHAPDPSIAEDERPAFAGKGRLVKARFPDDPAPNVSWFWIPVGNCRACGYFRPPNDPKGLGCDNPSIPRHDQLKMDGYLETNDCPGYEPGINKYEAEGAPRLADVMRAVGVIPDQPPRQRVEILQQLPWSPSATVQAHAQQNVFVGLAQEADDAAARGVAHGRGLEEDYPLDADLGDIQPVDE